MLERGWRRECAELTGGAAPAESEPYNLITPRSRCPSCQAPIKALQNIPVISYLLQGRRCAACKAPISARYPIVELFTAVLTAAVVWKFGVNWTALAALVLTWSLIALALIDLDTQLLPDSITLPLLWLGLLLSLTHGSGLITNLSIPTDLRSSVIGAAAGYLSLWSIFHLFKLLTGKEGMGYGDFKLLAVFGAWFGWQMLLPIVLLSAFTGAVVGIGLMVTRNHGREVPIPFGPYLAAAGWIALMWGPEIVERYLKLARL